MSGRATAKCPEINAPWNCDDRIPGERNLQCPLALAMGRENITQLLIAQRKREREWQIGIDFI